MSENPSPAKIAINHITRCREGYNLLARGNNLQAMECLPIGIDDQALISSRQGTIDELKTLSSQELYQRLNKVEARILHHESNKYVGTSGLNWLRNAILIVIEERD